MALDRLCRAAQCGVRACAECNPALAPDLLFATVAGSTAGVIVWWLAKRWPSLSLLSLMVALTTLLKFGKRPTVYAADFFTPCICRLMASRSSGSAR
jgi:hypothetical protein